MKTKTQHRPSRQCSFAVPLHISLTAFWRHPTQRPHFHHVRSAGMPTWGRHILALLWPNSVNKQSLGSTPVINASLHASAYERCQRSRLSYLSAGLMLTHGRFVTRQDADGTSVLLGNIRSGFSLDSLFLCTHKKTM